MKAQMSWQNKTIKANCRLPMAMELRSKFETTLRGLIVSEHESRGVGGYQARGSSSRPNIH